MTAVIEHRYRVDPKRRRRARSGVFVRAFVRTDKGDVYGSYDVADLDAESVQMWLRSRGEQNKWAEQFVMILLGHR